MNTADENDALVKELGNLLEGCPSLPGAHGRQYILADVLRVAIAHVRRVADGKKIDEPLAPSPYAPLLGDRPDPYTLMTSDERQIFNRVASLCGIGRQGRTGTERPGNEDLQVVLGAANNEIMCLRQKLDASKSPWRGLMEPADQQVELEGEGYAGFLGHLLRVANDTGITPMQAWLVFFSEVFSPIRDYMKTGEPGGRPIVGDFVKVLNHLRFGWLLTLDAKDAVVEGEGGGSHARSF